MIEIDFPREALKALRELKINEQLIKLLFERHPPNHLYYVANPLVLLSDRYLFPNHTQHMLRMIFEYCLLHNRPDLFKTLLTVANFHMAHGFSLPEWMDERQFMTLALEILA